MTICLTAFRCSFHQCHHPETLPPFHAGRSLDEITGEDLMKAERKIVSMLHTAVGRDWLDASRHAVVLSR